MYAAATMLHSHARWLRAALRSLHVRVAGASLALVLLVPVLAPLAAGHSCACGMKSGCFCELLAKAGAHCNVGGDGCAMRSCQPTSSEALLASLDLRGWLSCGETGVAAGPEPTGWVADLASLRPPTRSPRPLTPPPRPTRAG